jgi:hypothetical protein
VRIGIKAGNDAVRAANSVTALCARTHGVLRVFVKHQAARRRRHCVREKERSELAGKGAGSCWANLTPEERSAEMKRRAKVRKRDRARKAKSS